MGLRQPKPPLVLTTCSAGKRCVRTLSADSLQRAEQSEVAEAWLGRLRAETDVALAENLYQGRAFGLARRTAAVLQADLGVLSAGLGYVRGGTAIPSYDLTVRPAGPGSVVGRVTSPFDSVGWWEAVSRGPFSTALAPDLEGRDLVLACLSRAYASMVLADLCRFVRTSPGALRIFGLSIEAALPDELRPFVVPYDARLEAVGAPGTRVDFPQRALVDFVEHVLPVAGTLDDQRSAVLARLSGATASPPARRQSRADDAAIKARIARAIPQVGARSSAVLAHLRHVEGMSCEQRRFAHLFRAAKAEMVR